jgi:hypothetical protein
MYDRYDIPTFLRKQARLTSETRGGESSRPATPQPYTQKTA